MLILYSIIFVGLVMFGFSLIIQTQTSLSIIDLINSVIDKKDSYIDVSSCSTKERLLLSQELNDFHLTKLNEYESVCNSYVTDTLMIFMDMPKDLILADTKALDLSNTLKEFHQSGIKPLVIVEPVTEWGLIDFEEFDTGFYDIWINSFFEKLISYGVTDEMIGTWVPFPEANLPYWNRANATPSQFASVVNRYLKIVKTYYPSAKGSVLLNSATYESTDFDWENGEYISLVPYVEALDKTLISSFGIQGFPWVNDSTARVRRELFDANEFINPTITIEAAKTLEVSDVWINTGTFSSKYTLDPKSVVFIDDATRREILEDILEQGEAIKSAGFNVSINLFSQDKSNSEEATNWSYWGSYVNNEDPNIYVFKSFVKLLEEKGINLWLFDTSKETVYEPDRLLR